MPKWRGLMQAGDLLVPVTVTYTLPSGSGFGSWEGVGILDKEMPPEQFPTETNIGRIIIRHMLMGPSGGCEIMFTGSGEPSGPLAEAMGLR